MIHETDFKARIEAIKLLCDYRHSLFLDFVVETHFGNTPIADQLWDVWKQMTHAIEHLNSNWPNFYCADLKFPPAKEVAVAKIPQRHIR